MALWDLTYSNLPVEAPSSPATAAERPPSLSTPPGSTRRVYGPSSSRLSLETWEQLCPIKDSERESIAMLHEALSDRPPPPHLVKRPLDRNGIYTPAPQGVALLRKAHSSRPDLFQSYGLSSSPSRPSSPSTVLSAGQGVAEAMDPFDITRPIASVQNFNDWFSKVASLIEMDSESRYRQYLSKVVGHVASCEDVLSQLHDCRGLLREVDANWRFVDENSQSIERACEGKLEEQKQLDALAASLTERLGYFRRLEHAQRLLSLPGEAELVSREEFQSMLEGLDMSLEFMRTHPGFRDFDLYLVRFQQCLTRAMTLIRLHYVNVINNVVQDVGEKSAGKELFTAALESLLFNKFEAVASSLQPLVFELEKRAKAHPVEYGSLLSECHATWLRGRSTLIRARVALEVGRMDQVGRPADLVGLTRAGCNYLRGVCEREFRLFCVSFALSGREEIYAFLESLCDHLYDVIRPRILHEQRLDTLCELITVVQALVALDAELREGATDDPSSGVAGLPDDDMLKLADGSQTVHFSFAHLLQPLLQDAQSRLVFRAQAILEADVLHYVAKPDDLDYPACIEGKVSGLWGVPIGCDSAHDQGEALRFRLPPESVQASWYPTLRRTLWVLSKVHTYVFNSIFEDFAGEAVSMCRQSLAAAGFQLQKRNEDSLVDGQLFAVRHLLILKELVRHLDLVQIDRAVDLSPMTDALRNLLRNTATIFSPNALFQLAIKGVPTFAGTMKDVKQDLDAHLKRECGVFISSAVESLSIPLQNYVNKCGVYLSGPPGPQGEAKDLPSQEWATSEAVLKLFAVYRERLEVGVPDLRRRATIYLEDSRTVSVLMDPLRADLAAVYTMFLKIVKAEYSFTTSQRLPSAEQLSRDLLQMENST